MEANLEALKQQWEASGELADHVAYLRALAAWDAAEGERLELAAELAHPAAWEAMDREGEPGVVLGGDLRDWVFELERFGVVVSVRILIASARLLLSPEEPLGSPALRAIAVAEALLDCPCDTHEKAARKIWTEDADWAAMVPWAEIAAEIAWKAHWKTSEEAVRAAIIARLLPYALGEEGPPAQWDAEGTGGDLPPPKPTHDGSN